MDYLENNFRSLLSYGPVIDSNSPTLSYYIDDDDNLLISLYYPLAKSVSVKLDHDERIILSKNDSLFKGNLGKVKGVHHVEVKVDGKLVLNPFLPISFGYYRPINYIDIVDKNSIYAVHDVPHGSIETFIIKNSVTKRNDRILVYKPSSYSESQSLDVLFLQHGIGENETCWLSLGHIDAILDNMISSNSIHPILVVMANGMNTVIDEKDEIKCQNFSTYLMNDILPAIKEKFNIINCYMAGLSMGSMETSITTLQNPGIFRGIGLFSGFIQDFIGNYSGHITKNNLSKWTENSFLFRSIGDEDKYISHFLDDDKLLESEHIQNERKIYHGKHDWNVWRYSIVDFLKLMEEKR